MSYTSMVRTWAPTSKWCCYGFHILSIYSSSLTWDLMLRTWKIFRRPQPRKADIEPTSIPALTSSSPCCLSFHTTIFAEMTCQKSILRYYNTYPTIENTLKTFFWLGLCVLGRNLRHCLNRHKLRSFSWAPPFRQRERALPTECFLP